MVQSVAGTWVANLEKSQRHPNHQFRSATMWIEVNGGAVSLMQSGINMAGQEEASTLELLTDECEYPVSPQAPDVVVTTRWLAPHILETVGKRGDQVVGRATYEASEDGWTLTARVTASTQVIVFDRQEQGESERGNASARTLVHGVSCWR